MVAGCPSGSLLAGPNRAGGDRLPYLSAVAPDRAWQKVGSDCRASPTPNWFCKAQGQQVGPISSACFADSPCWHCLPGHARLQSNRNGHGGRSLGMRREGPGAFSISALAPASAPKCSASFAGQSKADESLAPGGGFRVAAAATVVLLATILLLHHSEREVVSAPTSHVPVAQSGWDAVSDVMVPAQKVSPASRSPAGTVAAIPESEGHGHCHSLRQQRLREDRPVSGNHPQFPRRNTNWGRVRFRARSGRPYCDE